MTWGKLIVNRNSPITIQIPVKLRFSKILSFILPENLSRISGFGVQLTLYYWQHRDSGPGVINVASVYINRFKI